MWQPARPHGAQHLQPAGRERRDPRVEPMREQVEGLGGQQLEFLRRNRLERLQQPDLPLGAGTPELHRGRRCRPSESPRAPRDLAVRNSAYSRLFVSGGSLPACVARWNWTLSRSCRRPSAAPRGSLPQSRGGLPVLDGRLRIADHSARCTAAGSVSTFGTAASRQPECPGRLSTAPPGSLVAAGVDADRLAPHRGASETESCDSTPASSSS